MWLAYLVSHICFACARALRVCVRIFYYQFCYILSNLFHFCKNDTIFCNFDTLISAFGDVGGVRECLSGGGVAPYLKNLLHSKRESRKTQIDAVPLPRRTVVRNP